MFVLVSLTLFQSTNVNTSLLQTKQVSNFIYSYQSWPLKLGHSTLPVPLNQCCNQTSYAMQFARRVHSNTTLKGGGRMEIEYLRKLKGEYAGGGAKNKYFKLKLRKKIPLYCFLFDNNRSFCSKIMVENVTSRIEISYWNFFQFRELKFLIEIFLWNSWAAKEAERNVQNLRRRVKGEEGQRWKWMRWGCHTDIYIYKLDTNTLPQNRNRF